MSLNDVWFAIPSANPAKCAKVLPVWRKMGYKIAILQNHTRGDVDADRVIWRDSYPGWPESINILCREVVPRDAPLVVSGGDDMLPDPNHTAQELLSQFRERFPDGYGVMQPHGDEFLSAKYYCGSPFLGRGWIDRAYRGRGPMPGQYRHNWADNELFWVARCQGALWERSDLTHYHDHFSRHGGAKEDYWTANVQRNDREDCRIFIARSWLGFPDSDSSDGLHTVDRAIFDREYLGFCEMYYSVHYGFNTFSGSGVDRMRKAFELCRERGDRRIVLFGAGSHTKMCSEVLMNPGVDILGIIEEHAQHEHQKLWNFPLISLDQAAKLRPDAVVLSSSRMEHVLAARARPLEAIGINIVRLYPELDAPSPLCAPAATR
jgi:hypothetical protein